MRPHDPREILINELKDKERVYQELLQSEDKSTQIIIKRILSNIEKTIIHIENTNVSDLEEIITSFLKRDLL